MVLHELCRDNTLTELCELFTINNFNSNYDDEIIVDDTITINWDNSEI